MNPFLSDRDEDDIHTTICSVNEPHLAVVTRISSSNHAVSIAMVRICFHLRIHSVVELLLLLMLSWLQRRLMIWIDVVTRNDTDLLVILVGTSCAMLLCVFQSVEEKFVSLIDQTSLWDVNRKTYEGYCGPHNV